jgi:hypothetical protein
MIGGISKVLTMYKEIFMNLIVACFQWLIELLDDQGE